MTMKNRRNFIKALAASTTVLALNETMKAQTTESLPAITSLLFDDDSAMVTCSDVACASFSVAMEYADIDINIELQIETPGGTRLIADGAVTGVGGQCNYWILGHTAGAGNQNVSVTLNDANINPGRYQIFAKHISNVFKFINISVAACGDNLGTGGNVSFDNNVSAQIGSINISSGGTTTIRVLGSTNV